MCVARLLMHNAEGSRYLALACLMSGPSSATFPPWQRWECRCTMGQRYAILETSTTACEEVKRSEHPWAKVTLAYMQPERGREVERERERATHTHTHTASCSTTARPFPPIQICMDAIVNVRPNILILLEHTVSYLALEDNSSHYNVCRGANTAHTKLHGYVCTLGEEFGRFSSISWPQKCSQCSLCAEEKVARERCEVW